MSITTYDILTVRRLLQQFADSQPMQAIYMDETEYVSRRLGDISRLRAGRLIIAARQNKTTGDIRRQRRKKS